MRWAETATRFRKYRGTWAGISLLSRAFRLLSPVYLDLFAPRTAKCLILATAQVHNGKPFARSKVSSVSIVFATNGIRLAE
jgi:hypothetical protein